MKNQKLNFISLKKTNNLNKAFSSSKSFFQNSKDEGPFYLLPIIDKTVINTAYHKPTSILTRYIKYHADKLIRTTEENLKKPTVLEEFEKELILKNKFKKNKQQLNFKTHRSKTLPNQMNIKDIAQSKEKDNDKDKENTKINRFYLTTLNQREQSTKSNKNLNISKNVLLNKNSTDFNSNWNKEFNLKEELDSQINTGKKGKIESSVSLDRELNKEKCKFLNNIFHRLRTYQPKIDANWKSINGLTIDIGAIKLSSHMEGDIEYQVKSLNDQYKLLLDNIKYYKMSVITKDNFMESFKCLSLKNKINYNQYLEEACGLILLLPQLILLEFYKYIEKYEKLNRPDKNKFKDKYIFDEISCLNYNNNLLTEVSEYLKNCFEVYLTLVKEVNDMSLKPKIFKNALSAFEKARFDISYICNIAETAMNNYIKDINIINKLNKCDILKTKKKSVNTILTYNLRNINNLKKNTDRQRRLRIEACLNNKEDEYNNKNNDFMFINPYILPNKRNFKSIIDSELITKILKHCKKDVKYEIKTQRINNELDDSYSGDNVKSKKTHNIIKLNF